jgi:hypothetical protein
VDIDCSHFPKKLDRNTGPGLVFGETINALEFTIYRARAWRAACPKTNPDPFANDWPSVDHCCLHFEVSQPALAAVGQ